MSASELGEALTRAMERVTAAGERAKSLANSPEALVQLDRVCADARAIQRLRTKDLVLARPSDLALATIDAEHLAQTLEDVSASRDGLFAITRGLRRRTTKRSASRAEMLQLALLLSERITRSIGYLALRPSEADTGLNDQLAQPADRARSDPILDTLVAEYQADAARQRAASKWLYATAVLFLVLSVSIALYGVAVARVDNEFRFSEFAAYCLIALVTLASSVVAVRRAARHGVAAQEATRLGRQFRGLDAYLSPLPPAVRDLIRATMAQRLFPGVIEDDEPWREPKWPDADAVLEAIRRG